MLLHITLHYVKNLTSIVQVDFIECDGWKGALSSCIQVSFVFL